MAMTPVYAGLGGQPFNLISRKFTGGSGAQTVVEVYKLFIAGVVDEHYIGNHGDEFGMPIAGDLLWSPEEDGPVELYATAIEVELEDAAVRVGTSTAPAIVTYQITYSSRFDAAASSLMPWERDPEWEFEGGNDATEAVYFDEEDEPIVNSAGDLYDPLPTRPVPGGRMRLTWNVEDNPAAALTGLKNTLNSSSYSGFAAGCVWMSDINCRKMQENIGGSVVVYYQISAVLQFALSEDGWRIFPVDNGCRVLNADDKLVAYKDEDGTVATSPVLLDGEGAKLAAFEPPVIYPEEGYRIMPEEDWSAIDIPEVI